MYSAVNTSGLHVEIEDAILEPNEKYFCLLCGSELIIKNGNINICHFAHKVIGKCDTFTTDMSEWHRTWQKQFPIENREIIIGFGNVKHRADICVNNYIIEFQHSTISQNEFDARNLFYTSAGYKIIWIFDFIEEYNNNSIVCVGETHEGGGKFFWKNPRKFMKNWNPKRDKNVMLIFQLSEATLNKDDDKNCQQNENIYFEKIEWVINENEESIFRRFFTSYSIGDIECVKQLVTEKINKESNESNFNKPKLNYGLLFGWNIVNRSTILAWQNSKSINWKVFIWYLADHFIIKDFGDEWFKIFINSNKQASYLRGKTIDYCPEIEESNFSIDVQNEMWKSCKRGVKLNSGVLIRLIKH